MARVDLAEDRATTPPSDPLAAWAPWAPTAAAGYIVSVAMTAIVTLVAAGIDRLVTIPNLSLLFVMPVIAAGASFGVGPAICAAILGPLAFNFFLTAPRYTLVVDDPANWWSICLLLVVGLIVSGVAFISRRRAADAAMLRRQARILRAYSREVLQAEGTPAVVSATSETLHELFQVPAVVMLLGDGEVLLKDGTGTPGASEDDLRAARAALHAGVASRAGVYPNVGSRFDFWPVSTRTGQEAVLGLAFDPDDRPGQPGLAVEVVAGMLALALDRRHDHAVG